MGQNGASNHDPSSGVSANSNVNPQTDREIAGNVVGQSIRRSFGDMNVFKEQYQRFDSLDEALRTYQPYKQKYQRVDGYAQRRPHVANTSDDTCPMDYTIVKVGKDLSADDRAKLVNAEPYTFFSLFIIANETV